MTKLQKLQLEQSEQRQKASGLLSKESLSEEERKTLDTCTTRLTELETEIRGAIVVDGTETAEEGDRQETEKRELAGKLELRRYLGSAGTEQRIADGPESEWAKEHKLPDFAVPWEAIAPTEERADANTTAPANVPAAQDPILSRVFAKGAAMWAGVRFPSVGVGERQYPVLTAGNTPAMKEKAAGHDSTAASWGVKTLSPKRMTARYTFAIEDAAVFQGMEAALREDLSGAIAQEIDKELLSGDGTGQHVSGFFDTTNGPLTAPDDPSAEAGVSDYIEGVSSSVDGRYALQNSDIKLLVGHQTNKHMSAKFVSDGADTTAMTHVKNISGGCRVSAHVPDVASKKQFSLACRKMGSAVAPVWQAPRLIRDPYSDASSGIIALTLHVLFAFAVPRADGWKLLSFQVKA